MGVEPARVGQQPYAGVSYGGILRADDGAWRVERHPVGGDPDDREPPRPHLVCQVAQTASARPHLVVGQLVGPRRRPRDHVGDPEAERAQLVLLGGAQQARGEAGAVQRRPEPVAGPPEVVPGQRRDEAGVDAAEQHGTRRVAGTGQHVGHRERPGGLQLGAGRAGHAATLAHRNRLRHTGSAVGARTPGCVRAGSGAGEDVREAEVDRALELRVACTTRARGPGATARTGRCAGTGRPPCSRSGPRPPVPGAAGRRTGPCRRSTGCTRSCAACARPARAPPSSTGGPRRWSPAAAARPSARGGRPWGTPRPRPPTPARPARRTAPAAATRSRPGRTCAPGSPPPRSPRCARA